MLPVYVSRAQPVPVLVSFHKVRYSITVVWYTTVVCYTVVCYMIKPEEIFFIQNIKIHHLQVKQNLKGGKSKSRGANAPPTPLKEFVPHVSFVYHMY